MNERSIDYWGLVTRSLDVVRNHKILWFFGFFAASGGGGGNGVSEGWSEARDFLLSRPSVLIAIVLFAVVLWLVLFAMSMISRGALISGSLAADRGGVVSFNSAWESGLASALGMLGLTALSILAFLVVTLIVAVPVILPIMAGAPGIAIAILIGAVLFFPYLAFVFMLAFTVTYAERALALEHQGVLDSIRTGWNLARSEVWRSFGVWLVSLASNLVFMLVLLIGMLMLAIPFIALGVANLMLALAVGIPIGVIILIVYSAAVGTYNYALWTFAYADLTNASRRHAEPLPVGSVAVSPVETTSPTGAEESDDEGR